MHSVKATDLVTLRRQLADEAPEALEAIRARMPSELRRVLDASVASTWLPDPQIVEIYGHFCAVLHPGVLHPYVQLGRRAARASYGGVYRIFLAIPSTAFVIDKAARMWAAYHSSGTATVEEVTSGGALFVVRGAEPIRREMLDFVSGHILALAELTRARDAKVVVASEGDGIYRWTVRWR
ncbi:MAG: hypothetical protein K1X94_27815 [Sandaracinaceae bacterium]|nr:hypothetical protein [Sandaracinaceae bacterium]